MSRHTEDLLAEPVHYSRSDVLREAVLDLVVLMALVAVAVLYIAFYS